MTDPDDARDTEIADAMIERAAESAEAKLTEHVRLLRAAIQLFCDRRDRGEIQSTTTYRQFKQVLKLTEAGGDK